jgi:hypothetical protein
VKLVRDEAESEALRAFVVDADLVCSELVAGLRTMSPGA